VIDKLEVCIIRTGRDLLVNTLVVSVLLRFPLAATQVFWDIATAHFSVAR
jgi:hypothetical protein